MSRYRSLATALRRQTAAVARRSAEPGSPVSGLVDAYRSSTDNLRGSSDGLTDSVQRLSRLTDAITVIDLASASGRDVAETAAFFADLRSTLGTETLSSTAAGLEPAERFAKLAIERIAGDPERGEIGRASCRERVCEYV